ncbi:MAG TPA: hypothetical protein VHY91_22805 [Pirellulales bacterium]|jgi:hypothetical protein|nr:hypothetical protein [Pirellulales bacterium]
MPRQVETAGRLMRWPLAWLALLGVWLAVCAGSVRAADSEVVPYNDALKSRRTAVEQMLREGQIPAGKDELFDEYVTKYFLPQFVLKSNGNNLRGVRDTFHKKMVLPAVPSAARTRLLQLTLENFSKYLNDPNLGKSFAGTDSGKWTAWTAAKCNIITTLGELNETESTPNARAKPLPEALPIVLEIAKPPTKATRGRDDALRIAALNALERHAENPATSGEMRTKMRETMLAIIDQRKPPVGRDVSVNDWLRARAADVLSEMKDVGPKNQVVVALDRVINNPGESARLRCQAARTLGSLEFPTGSTLDFKSLADHIGRLVDDVCKSEIDRAQDSPINSDARRRLKASVRDALEGLYREGGRSGLIAGATDPVQREFVENVSKKVKRIDEVIDKDTNGEIAAAKLAAPMKDLEGILAPRAEAKEAAPAEKTPDEAEALAGSAIDARAAK